MLILIEGAVVISSVGERPTPTHTKRVQQAWTSSSSFMPFVSRRTTLQPRTRQHTLTQKNPAGLDKQFFIHLYHSRETKGGRGGGGGY